MKLPSYSKEEKKAIAIYCGELLLFGIVFVVLGILFLLHIIGVGDWKRYAFTYVTLIGGCWPIADFFWTLFSKKHRSNNSLLDKILILPAPLCTIPCDIWILTKGIANVELSFFQILIGSIFCYFGAVYLFECVYHYFVPIPGLLEESQKSDENKPSENTSSEENKK